MAPSKLAKQTRKDARRDAAAAYQLSMWYSTGEEGLSRDLELSLKWEWEAAERGCADAQYMLGVGFYHGSEGFQVDHAIALAWYQKAAIQGRSFIHKFHSHQHNWSTLEG